MRSSAKEKSKPSKLREKPTRVPSVQLERKAEVIRKYVSHVGQRPNLSEHALGIALIQLLRDLLLEANPEFLQEYLQGVEHAIAGPKATLYNRGRTDAFYGNLLIEFKRNLSKSLEEATEQLKRYIAILQSRPEDRSRPLIAMATDGIQFVAYAPRFAPDKHSLSPEDVQLVETESANLETMSPEEAYYWLDRYFTRQTGPLAPKTKQIVEDFGPTSGSYVHTMNVLAALWKAIAEDTETQVFYDSWQKYLRITYGGPVAETELFLRHTYLATLSKLMVWVRLTGATEPPPEPELRAVLNGRYFAQRGIQNFMEEDFFAWLARDAAWPLALTASRRLLFQLGTYNLRELSEDVLKGLYERLVDPKDRHDLGEYYTPDWLAARIVQECLGKNPEASVLDPSCGSGTFLYQTILFKKEKLGETAKTLKHIEGNVVGMDIHPLAVIVAKTTYLLGLGDLLERRVNAIRIPVYLSDSIKPPEQHVRKRTAAQAHLEFGTYGVALNGDVVNLPEDLALSDQLYDRAIELCSEYARSTAGGTLPSGVDYANFLRRSEPGLARNPVWQEALYGLFRILRKKIQDRKDTIWAFVLKNVFKPLLLKGQFDVLVGNPPWLTYNQIERGHYQQYIKELIVAEYSLCEPKLGLLTQLELGTLFFVRCSDLYLKSGGTIGFVLPRSIFSSDQHSNLRTGTFRPELRFNAVWDLEKVDPLFNVPSCVLLAAKGERISGPLSCRKLSGRLPRKNASVMEADEALSTEERELWPARAGTRSYYSDKKGLSHAGNSPYAAKFIQGAVIYPRSFWFVQVKSDATFGIDKTKPYVETASDAIKKAKKDYQGIAMRGNVEAEFLYGTFLSTDLVPFGFTRMRMVVLPIRRLANGWQVVTPSEARKDGFLSLAEWLDKAEQLWAEIRKEKAQREGGITARLDYVHQLSKQHRKNYTVTYPASATNLCGCVISNAQRHFDLQSASMELQGFVAHGETYYYDTDSIEEAMYLAAFLNSPYADTLLKPLQSRGLFGPRHIHKKIWALPFPQLDPSCKTHKELARLGSVCNELASGFVSSLPEKIRNGSVGRLRGLVRERLKNELAEIDNLVRSIMQ